MPPEPLTLSGVDIPPYPYGWYYDENGNLVNGETGETFWDIPWETQDLFYRDVLESVKLSGNLGQDNIEPAIDNLSTEVGRWLDSEELYQWAEAEAKQRWENQVMQNIPPQNTADPITPETHVIAPWDGGGREPTPRTSKLYGALARPARQFARREESYTTPAAAARRFARREEDRARSGGDPDKGYGVGGGRGPGPGFGYSPSRAAEEQRGIFRERQEIDYHLRRTLNDLGITRPPGLVTRSGADIPRMKSLVQSKLNDIYGGGQAELPPTPKARPETPGGREDRFTTHKVSKPPTPKELFPGFGRRGIR